MTNDFQPPSSPKAKKGGVWKWIAIGCGSLTLLLIALVGIGGFWLARNMGVSVDSTQVEDKAKTIFNYAIPGGSKGYLTMTIFGVDIVQVSSLESPPNVLLTMGVLPPQFQSEAMRDEFLNGFRESYPGSNEETITFTSERTETLVLCEQPVPVTIQQGTAEPFGSSTVRPVVSYAATVEYESRALFAWVVSAGDRASENVESVFNSLECQ